MTAVEGILHLMNELYPVLSPDSPTRRPLTTLECNEISSNFRKSHFPRTRMICDISDMAFRFEAQTSWQYRLLARFVVPLFSNIARLWVFKPIFQGAPTFNFLERDLSKPISNMPA